LPLPTDQHSGAEVTLDLQTDSSSATPNGSINYRFTVSAIGGIGPIDVPVYSVEPARFASSTWSCLASGGAICPSPNGSGSINERLTSMPNGSAVTYSIAAQTDSNVQPSVDYRVGVNVALPITCIPADCLATLSLPLGATPTAHFAISKTADRSALDPGGTVRYTIEFANTGTENAFNVQLLDSIPSGLSAFAWTCNTIDGISCPQTSGVGPISETISFFPSNTSLTYTVDATVSPSASGTVSNRARLFASNVICEPVSCQAVSALPVVGQAAVLSVSKTAFPASGTPVSAGQPIAWTVLASNSGGPASAALVLTDTLPSSVAAISVQPDSGVTCNTLTPVPGSTLTCTVAAGFTGQRGVQISATVAANASGTVVNVVDASGSDNPVCASCTVSNPVAQSVDVAIANARPFSAAGIPGTLIDIANMSSVAATATIVTVSPGSALRLFAAYAGGCTATAGADGSISVSCPNPPSAQGIACSASTCSLASLPSNAAATLFVALNAGATATVTAVVPGDTDPTDNSIVLPIGGTP
jgi:uncharacterized repeat protein (TIGR01451 family)